MRKVSLSLLGVYAAFGLVCCAPSRGQSEAGERSEEPHVSQSPAASKPAESRAGLLSETLTRVESRKNTAELGRLYLRVYDEIDIDGDRMADEADFVYDPIRAAGASSPTNAVMLRIVSSQYGVMLEPIPGDFDAGQIGMDYEPPGTMSTYCGRRGKCRPDEPPEVQLPYGGISVFYFEASSRLYFIENGEIRNAWLSD